MPLLSGEQTNWRDYVVSEYDYSQQVFREKTGNEPLDCRSYMIANHEWKYIFAPGFPPLLFDLQNDPDEFHDLGRSADHAEQVARMHNALADWSLQYRQRETVSEDRARDMTGLEDKFGVLIGYWNEDDVKPPAMMPSKETKSKFS